jgi:hypothetical protein
VIPGHPFFTEWLDREREEQRLILAGIPEQTLEAVGIDRAKPVLPERTGRVETTVRRLAGSLIAAVPARVLEVVALSVERQALGAWASEVDWSGWPDHVVKMVADEARTSSDDKSYVDQLVKRHDDALGRLAALLVWADDLADDYVDPRIGAWRDQM